MFRVICNIVIIYFCNFRISSSKSTETLYITSKTYLLLFFFLILLLLLHHMILNRMGKDRRFNCKNFMFVINVSFNINPRRHKGGGGQSDPPSIFLALNFCSLADYQKLWHNCSLFAKTFFDPN